MRKDGQPDHSLSLHFKLSARALRHTLSKLFTSITLNRLGQTECAAKLEWCLSKGYDCLAGRVYAIRTLLSTQATKSRFLTLTPSHREFLRSTHLKVTRNLAESTAIMWLPAYFWCWHEQENTHFQRSGVSNCQLKCSPTSRVVCATRVTMMSVY